MRFKSLMPLAALVAASQCRAARWRPGVWIALIFGRMSTVPIPRLRTITRIITIRGATTPITTRRVGPPIISRLQGSASALLRFWGRTEPAVLSCRMASAALWWPSSRRLVIRLVVIF